MYPKQINVVVGVAAKGDNHGVLFAVQVEDVRAQRVAEVQAAAGLQPARRRQASPAGVDQLDGVVVKHGDECVHLTVHLEGGDPL